MWNFETIFESEGFIKSNFFWDDTFISMEKWSDSVVTKPRPIWVNISGVPLNFWNDIFFSESGESLG